MDTLNEIILDVRGNTYIGELAARFVYHDGPEVPKIFKLDPRERFHVFEVNGNEVIHRASQSTRDLALRYMATANRVLVHREEKEAALIARLDSLYCDSCDSYGRAIDRAVQMIREAGFVDARATNLILVASLYAHEQGRRSVTDLVLACSRT